MVEGKRDPHNLLKTLETQVSYTLRELLPFSFLFFTLKSDTLALRTRILVVEGQVQIGMAQRRTRSTAARGNSTPNGTPQGQPEQVETPEPQVQGFSLQEQTRSLESSPVGQALVQLLSNRSNSSSGELDSAPNFAAGRGGLQRGTLKEPNLSAGVKSNWPLEDIQLLGMSWTPRRKQPEVHSMTSVKVVWGYKEDETLLEFWEKLRDHASGGGWNQNTILSYMLTNGLPHKIRSSLRLMMRDRRTAKRDVNGRLEEFDTSDSVTPSSVTLLLAFLQEKFAKPVDLSKRMSNFFQLRYRGNPLDFWIAIEDSARKINFESEQESVGTEVCYNQFTHGLLRGSMEGGGNWLIELKRYVEEHRPLKTEVILAAIKRANEIIGTFPKPKNGKSKGEDESPGGKKRHGQDAIGKRAKQMLALTLETLAKQFKSKYQGGGRRLTREEFSSILKHNACAKCYEKGHRARDCTKFPEWLPGPNDKQKS